MLYSIYSFLFIFCSFTPYAEEMMEPLVSYKETEEAAMGAFRKVQVNGENGRYTVTGEARSESGEFYYVVEDGHYEFIPEKKLKTKENWSAFEINIKIPKENMPESGTIILYLYERNIEGKMVNALPVILEKIQQADT